MAFVKQLPDSDDVDAVLDHLIELLLPFAVTSGMRDILRDELLGGGAQDGGPLLWLWSAAYLVLLGVAARVGFARRDL